MYRLSIDLSTDLSMREVCPLLQLLSRAGRWLVVQGAVSGDQVIVKNLIGCVLALLEGDFDLES